MENQHRLVKGYRDLSQEEIDLMNEVKGLEQQVGQLWQRVKSLDGVDGRCVAHARTQLQDGFMWLVRGIAQPADPFVEKAEDWVDLERTRDSLMARILANKEMPVLGRGTIERLESQLAWVEKKLAERQRPETFYTRLVAERDDLAARTAKLEAFVNASQFGTMEQEDIDDLVSQLPEMRALLSRLEKRVERLKPEDRQP